MTQTPCSLRPILGAGTLSLMAAGALAEGALPVPSGQLVHLSDRRIDADGPSGRTLRLGFVAPAIARDTGSVGFDAAATDMAHLCETVALAELSDDALPDQIVISMADRAVEFGQMNPDATQYFEAFRPENGRCIWEAF